MPTCPSSWCPVTRWWRRCSEPGRRGWWSASRSRSRPSSSRRRCAARSRGKPTRTEREPRIPRLVLVPDRKRTGGRDLVAVVAAALDAGLPAVQLRDKDLPGRPLLALAERLRAATARTGALLLVNDRVDVALACGADGVHLGGGSMPVDVARRLVGPEGLIGV